MAGCQQQLSLLGHIMQVCDVDIVLQTGGEPDVDKPGGQAPSVYHALLVQEIQNDSRMHSLRIMMYVYYYQIMVT